MRCPGYSDRLPSAGCFAKHVICGISVNPPNAGRWMPFQLRRAYLRDVRENLPRVMGLVDASTSP